MKATKVSALSRSWRDGLRPDVCREAEPQSSELVKTMERKTDTMKTYLLRPHNSVEPQKAQPIAIRADKTGAE